MRSEQARRLRTDVQFGVASGWIQLPLEPPPRQQANHQLGGGAHQRSRPAASKLQPADTRAFNKPLWLAAKASDRPGKDAVSIQLQALLRRQVRRRRSRMVKPSPRQGAVGLWAVLSTAFAGRPASGFLV